jgi:hypothetical protein
MTGAQRLVLKTRSKKAFALVADGRIVGYAHARTPAVDARARRLKARIIRITNGMTFSDDPILVIRHWWQ